jgi:Tol biopolymer transport system component
MKTTLIILLIVILRSLTCFSQVQVEMNEEQQYGQKPPGAIPEMYKPKFGFLEGIEYNDLAFSPSGIELCYSMRDTSAKQSYIYYLKKEKGNWTTPELAYFIPNNSTGDLPQFSPDGKRFSYTCKGDFWSCTKKNNKWTVAEKMPEPVCTKEYECGFSFAKSGSIYFASSGRPDGKGRCDIYCSTLKNNQFGTPQNISNLNTDASECVVSVSPDEKYIVFTRFLLKDGQNATDLYISFRKQNGEWTLAQKLGTLINSPGANNNPTFSSDGKYFFFSQILKKDTGTYVVNKYWVSTIMFDDLRESSVAPIKNE